MSLGKRKADQIEDAAMSRKPRKVLPPLRVSFLEGASSAKPIIATIPGASLPPNLKFNSYTRIPQNGSSETLLHSTTHPTIDFTSTENDTQSDKHLKHYVAVFDPVTGNLQVAEAKRLTVRSRVRRREAAFSEDDASDGETNAVTNYSSRATLTNTFGTKKSKKAVQSIAENRLLARGGDDTNNPLSKAIISSMPQSDIPEETDTRLLAQSNKPLPKPDLNTEDMPIATWVDSISKGKDVKTDSRFVALRVQYLIRAHLSSIEDETLKLNVQLLRYILFLIEISRYLGSLRPHSSIASPSSWKPKTITGNLPFPMISEALAQFFPTGQITTPGTTLLRTTILALTLHIPPPSLEVASGTLVSELSDIQLDLALEPEVCSKYYRELGCKISSPTDGELILWKLDKLKRKKDDSGKPLPKPKMAKLTLPLTFPTISMGRRQGRR